VSFDCFDLGKLFTGLLPISYTVAPPVGGDVPLSATPSSVTLNTVENGSTATVLAVTPPSWNPQVTATVEYPANAASGWLTPTAVTGGFQLSANATGLLAGSYTATVRLHGAYPATDVLVPVALTVGPGLVRPADTLLTVTAETVPANLIASVPITLAAGPAVGWSASANVPWLGFTQASGTTGQSLTYQIDSAQRAALPNGATYPATITVTPASPTMTPITFLVTVNKQLPAITRRIRRCPGRWRASSCAGSGSRGLQTRLHAC